MVNTRGNNKLLSTFFALMIAFAVSGCDESDDTNPNVEDDQNGSGNGQGSNGTNGEGNGNGSGTPTPSSDYHYFVGIESGTDPSVDILASADSLTASSISPINNGFEQAAWSTFYQGIDQIIVGGYTSAPEFVSYEVSNGELVKGESFFTNQGIYAVEFVDESTAILVGSARSGFAEKTIFKINTNTMSIENGVTTNFGDVVVDSLLAFPVDAEVRGSKLFIAYYHIHARGDFSTPGNNSAEVAVFSYPELKFEKVIKDERAPAVGRYYTTNALEMDENGDIYTYSPSSLACGYAPVPSKNSGILRIRSGETEFDPNYHIDFETLSEGYKINDMFYVADGKAVVRVLKEDETIADYLWATYAPVSTQPLLETGIIDLKNKTFKLLPEVPKGGGGWNAAYLVDGKKLYLSVSSSQEASVYVIDTESETAVKGAKIEGNYAKGLLRLPK